MGRASLLLASSLVFLSACELQDLLGGGGGRDESSGEVLKSAPVPNPTSDSENSVEQTNPHEDAGEESFEELYELARRHPRVASLAEDQRTLEREGERLNYLPRFEFLTDAYNFARDTRRLPTDAERDAFSNEMLQKGMKFYAVYKYVYVFAQNTRRLATEAERHAFAFSRSQTLRPIYDGTLLVHSYALATDLRRLPTDAERIAFAWWVDEKAKSVTYMSLYEDAYVYARDVRRLPTDAERHAFATQEADRDAR